MVVLVLALYFHVEDPDLVGDGLYILLFPNLSITFNYKVTLIFKWWHITLDSSA